MIFTRFSVGITKMGFCASLPLQHTRAQVRHSLQRRGDQAVLGEQWAVLHQDGHIVRDYTFVAGNTRIVSD